MFTLFMFDRIVAVGTHILFGIHMVMSLYNG